MNRIQAAEERNRAMLALLASRETPMTVEQAADAIKCSKKEARLALYRLQYASLAVYEPRVRGPEGLWGRPDMRQAMRDERQQNRDETKRKKREYERERYSPVRVQKAMAAKALREAQRAAEQVEDHGVKPFVHRRIPASEAPRIFTRGVPSVFHLGLGVA